MTFLALCVCLILFGTLMNYSSGCVYAEQTYGSRTYFLWRHVFFALGSVALTAPLVAFATPVFWRKMARVIYFGSIFLLLLVLVIGTVGGGARRWLAIGPLTIQPSEVAKLGIILMLSLFLSDHEKQVLSTGREGFRYGVLMPGLIIGLVGVLVALEHHISGLMIIGMIGITVMFLGGTDVRYLLLIFGTVALAGVGLVLVSDYAGVRVNTWLHIDTVDPLGEAWQTLQGLYAIGSGGFFGRGLFGSRQKFGYVSQPQNDFIFTVLCEELGFFGGAVVIALFAALLIRGCKIATHLCDKFSALVVMGLLAKVALQTILNIAVVTNSMPNTGISLPFFSSGGTSLALQIFEMGIVLNLSRYSTVRK